MIDVWDLSQYYYCPNKFYFYKVFGIETKTRSKMDFASEEHVKEKKRVKERKEIFGFKKDLVEKILFDVYLESKREQLKGRVDAVIILKDGNLIPIELKYSSFTNIQLNWRKQLIAYALLLAENYKKKVKQGVLYYTSQKRAEKIRFTDLDFDLLRKDIKKLHQILKKELKPAVLKSNKKCAYCELENICVE